MTPQDELIARIEDEARDTARWTGRTAIAASVLAALRKVRREAFVNPADEDRAYVNAPLPIGCGQTISQPFIVALMTDLLELQRTDRVLEVGTGSGYQAAVLAELADSVASIEVIPELAKRAGEVLQTQGYGRIALRTGDGGQGWPERAPFDAIIVTAAARSGPAGAGGAACPGRADDRPDRRAERRTGTAADDQGGRRSIDERGVLSVAFVPLTGAS